MPRFTVTLPPLVRALLEGCDARQRAAVLEFTGGGTALSGRLDPELRAELARLPVPPAAEAGLTLYPLLHVLGSLRTVAPQGLETLSAELPLAPGDPGFELLAQRLRLAPDAQLEARWRDAVAAFCNEQSFAMVMSLESELSRRAQLAASIAWGHDPQAWPREAFARLQELEVAFY